jgi:hypothetical protein
LAAFTAGRNARGTSPLGSHSLWIVLRGRSRGCATLVLETQRQENWEGRGAMKSAGVAIMLAGVFLVLLGLAFFLSDKLPFIGRLPGDIHIKGKHTSFSFPIVTCILISIILTAVINLIVRLINR